MNYDEDKIDEYTLALLYLVTHDRQEGFGARAWKGFDWDTMNRLYEKGYISNPIGKAKSIAMTEEGFLKSEELFERHFLKKIQPIPFPKMTPPAKKRWDEIPEQMRKKILENVWCSKCLTMVKLQLREGRMSGRSLVLKGVCNTCGGEAARVIEPVEE
ncbi:MAG TPA: DUF6429 family protein [Smithellaceae bacterium]|jgi:hypothetical protein|nr:hypothetical protein [Syntrophaceae bacterium]OQC73105.1 MAG: hypothetical protein BWX45_00687 [Deltaproteobacteria bacterium ADurb.Bin002]HNY97338.1 DUF6429 family protein [Smithellaceae bacterium]MBP9532761.1 hypothetical protein [Syntrophaceae bacterium]HOD63303.1 DUF6429 family protein [Smithellaceae bacterium]